MIKTEIDNRVCNQLHIMNSKTNTSIIQLDNGFLYNVIPAKAGIQGPVKMDTCLRRYEDHGQDGRGTIEVLNAFCVDLEEWFHICGVRTPYDDPASWAGAPVCVEKDTEVLLGLLAEAGAKGTFLSIGWLAEKYPQLIRRISNAGHEIGSHGYYHRLIYEQKPEEFREEIRRSRKILQDVTGQDVVCFRAPGFSMKRECFWAYPILAEEGIRIDVSIVPAARDHGGVEDFSADPFLLETEAGELTVFPVSVMQLAGRTTPFSGGGYLRLFPLALVRYGFRQNHRHQRPVMTYIHPREINPEQPRLALPMKKRFKYYVGLKGAEQKLRQLLREYSFGTVSQVMAGMGDLERYHLQSGQAGYDIGRSRI